MSESRPIGPLPNETGESIEVRIDTNVMPSLNWRLRAEQPVIHAEIGVPTIAFLDLVNRSDTAETARGLFSVTPDPASYHFMKADNFTTKNVSLDPGETVRIPIAFYFDRTTTTDPEMTGIRAATVSYTFSPAKNSSSTVTLRTYVATAMHDVADNSTVRFTADPAE